MSLLEDYRYVVVTHEQTCCRFHESALAHHDSLLRVTDSVEDALALLDLAVTWAELDYSSSVLVPVEQWREFVTAHRWRDRALAQRIFDLATEIATQSALLAARPDPGE